MNAYEARQARRRALARRQGSTAHNAAANKLLARLAPLYKAASERKSAADKAYALALRGANGNVPFEFVEYEAADARCRLVVKLLGEARQLAGPQPHLATMDTDTILRTILEVEDADWRAS